MLNIDNSVTLHLRNSNKQQLILNKFYNNNAALWITSDTKTWKWSVLGWHHKSCCSYCLLRQI